MAILRIGGVLHVTGHKSKTSVHNAVHSGLLTEPVPIGMRAVGWPDYEVEAVTAARVAGQSDEAIRALVGRLHAQRAERFNALTQAPAMATAAHGHLALAAVYP